MAVKVTEQQVNTLAIWNALLATTGEYAKTASPALTEFASTVNNIHFKADTASLEKLKLFVSDLTNVFKQNSQAGKSAINMIEKLTFLIKELNSVNNGTKSLIGQQTLSDLKSVTLEFSKWNSEIQKAKQGLKEIGGMSVQSTLPTKNINKKAAAGSQVKKYTVGGIQVEDYTESNIAPIVGSISGDKPFGKPVSAKTPIPRPVRIRPVGYQNPRSAQGNFSQYSLEGGALGVGQDIGAIMGGDIPRIPSRAAIPGAVKPPSIMSPSEITQNASRRKKESSKTMEQILEEKIDKKVKDAEYLSSPEWAQKRFDKITKTLNSENASILQNISQLTTISEDKSIKPAHKKVALETIDILRKKQDELFSSAQDRLYKNTNQTQRKQLEQLRQNAFTQGGFWSMNADQRGGTNQPYYPPAPQIARRIENENGAWVLDKNGQYQWRGRGAKSGILNIDNPQPARNNVGPYGRGSDIIPGGGGGGNTPRIPISNNQIGPRPDFDNPNRPHSMLERSFTTAAYRTLAYGTIGAAVWTARSEITNMIQVISIAEQKMVTLRKLMDPIKTDFNYIKKEMFGIAEETGRAFTEAGDVMGDFARQGKNTADVVKLTKQVLIMSNIGEMTPDEGVSNLTSLLAQFNLTAKDSEDVIDRLNNVSNKNAVSFKNLAASVVQTGAAYQGQGGNMHELLGIVTAMSKSTQLSGSVMGRVLRTSFSRMMRPEVEGELGKLGINYYDEKHQLKSPYKILSELSPKWGGLSTTKQLQLATDIGGERYRSYFQALMNNFQVASKAYTDSLNSQGSAYKENQEYMKSYAAKVSQTQTAWSEVAEDIGKNGFLDWLKGVAEFSKTIAKSGAFAPTAGNALITTALGMGGMYGVGSKMNFAGYTRQLTNASYDATTRMSQTGTTLQFLNWIRAKQWDKAAQAGNVSREFKFEERGGVALKEAFAGLVALGPEVWALIAAIAVLSSWFIYLYDHNKKVQKEVDLANESLKTLPFAVDDFATATREYSKAFNSGSKNLFANELQISKAYKGIDEKIKALGHMNDRSNRYFNQNKEDISYENQLRSYIGVRIGENGRYEIKTPQNEWITDQKFATLSPSEQDNILKAMNIRAGQTGIQGLKREWGIGQDKFRQEEKKKEWKQWPYSGWDVQEYDSKWINQMLPRMEKENLDSMQTYRKLKELNELQYYRRIEVVKSEYGRNLPPNQQKELSPEKQKEYDEKINKLRNEFLENRANIDLGVSNVKEKISKAAKKAAEEGVDLEYIIKELSLGNKEMEEFLRSELDSYMKNSDALRVYIEDLADLKDIIDKLNKDYATNISFIETQTAMFKYASSLYTASLPSSMKQGLNLDVSSLDVNQQYLSSLSASGDKARKVITDMIGKGTFKEPEKGSTLQILKDKSVASQTKYNELLAKGNKENEKTKKELEAAKQIAEYDKKQLSDAEENYEKTAEFIRDLLPKEDEALRKILSTRESILEKVNQTVEADLGIVGATQMMKETLSSIYSDFHRILTASIQIQVAFDKINTQQKLYSGNTNIMSSFSNKQDDLYLQAVKNRSQFMEDQYTYYTEMYQKTKSSIIEMNVLGNEFRTKLPGGGKAPFTQLKEMMDAGRLKVSDLTGNPEDLSLSQISDIFKNPDVWASKIREKGTPSSEGTTTYTMQIDKNKAAITELIDMARQPGEVFQKQFDEAMKQLSVNQQYYYKAMIDWQRGYLKSQLEINIAEVVVAARKAVNEIQRTMQEGNISRYITGQTGFIAGSVKRNMGIRPGMPDYEGDLSILGKTLEGGISADEKTINDLLQKRNQLIVDYYELLKQHKNLGIDTTDGMQNILDQIQKIDNYSKEIVDKFKDDLWTKLLIGYAQQLETTVNTIISTVNKINNSGSYNALQFIMEDFGTLMSGDMSSSEGIASVVEGALKTTMDEYLKVLDDIAIKQEQIKGITDTTTESYKGMLLILDKQNEVAEQLANTLSKIFVANRFVQAQKELNSLYQQFNTLVQKSNIEIEGIKTFIPLLTAIQSASGMSPLSGGYINGQQMKLNESENRIQSLIQLLRATTNGEIGTKEAASQAAKMGLISSDQVAGINTQSLTSAISNAMAQELQKGKGMRIDVSSMEATKGIYSGMIGLLMSGSPLGGMQGMSKISELYKSAGSKYGETLYGEGSPAMREAIKQLLSGGTIGSVVGGLTKTEAAQLTKYDEMRRKGALSTDMEKFTEAVINAPETFKNAMPSYLEIMEASGAYLNISGEKPVDKFSNAVDIFDEVARFLAGSLMGNSINLNSGYQATKVPLGVVPNIQNIQPFTFPATLNVPKDDMSKFQNNPLTMPSAPDYNKNISNLSTSINTHFPTLADAINKLNDLIKGVQSGVQGGVQASPRKVPVLNLPNAPQPSNGGPGQFPVSSGPIQTNNGSGAWTTP
jgi:TP901 family phage tail tape measure protein